MRGSGSRRYGRRRASIWFWVFVAVVVVILLGLLFGGYRKGSKVDATAGPTCTVTSAASTGPGAIIPAWRTCTPTT